MSAGEHLADVIALPHPARVAAQVVRMVLATSSGEDPTERAGIARTVIDLARRNGQLRRRYGPGVGGIPRGDGTWWVAAVCLECCWVGEVTFDEGAARAESDAHRCRARSPRWT
jgi:hypothetical protein